MKGGKALALFRRRPVKGKVPLSVFLRGVTHHRSGGRFKNTVFVLGHLLTSRFILFYSILSQIEGKKRYIDTAPTNFVGAFYFG